MTETHFVRVDEAARLAGMHVRTLRRRVADQSLPTVIDPRDRRIKLIRVADLKTYCGEVGLAKHAS